MVGSGRSQRVVEQGLYSHSIAVSSGIPQAPFLVLRYSFLQSNRTELQIMSSTTNA